MLIICLVLPSVGCDRLFTDYSPDGNVTTSPETKDDGPIEFTVNRKKDIITILSLFEGKTVGDIVSAMILRFNTDDNTLSVMQIPVNLYFDAEGSLALWYKNKYAASLAAGEATPTASAVSAVKSLIEESLCIPIDHTTHMTYDQLIGAIDAMGGIKMNIPYAIGLENGKVLSSGYQTLDGSSTVGLMVYSGYSSDFKSALHIHKLLLNAFITTLRNDVDSKVFSTIATYLRGHMTTTITGTGGADVFLLRKLAAADVYNTRYACLAVERVTLAAGGFSVVCKKTAVEQINELLSIFVTDLTEDKFDKSKKLTSSSVAVVSAVYQSTISMPSVYTAKDISDGKIRIG